MLFPKPRVPLAVFQKRMCLLLQYYSLCMFLCHSPACSDCIMKSTHCLFRSLLQIITFSGAIGLQSNSACLVGHLHLSHVSTSHSHTAGRSRPTVNLPFSQLTGWSLLQLVSVLSMRSDMVSYVFVSSCHVLSPPGFQLPLREKRHQIHRRLYHRGGKKRSVVTFINDIFNDIPQM